MMMALFEGIEVEDELYHFSGSDHQTKSLDFVDTINDEKYWATCSAVPGSMCEKTTCLAMPVQPRSQFDLGHGHFYPHVEIKGEDLDGASNEEYD